MTALTKLEHILRNSEYNWKLEGTRDAYKRTCRGSIKVFRNRLGDTLEISGETQTRQDEPTTTTYSFELKVNGNTIASGQGVMETVGTELEDALAALSTLHDPEIVSELEYAYNRGILGRKQ